MIKNDPISVATLLVFHQWPQWPSPVSGRPQTLAEAIIQGYSRGSTGHSPAPMRHTDHPPTSERPLVSPVSGLTASPSSCALPRRGLGIVCGLLLNGCSWLGIGTSGALSASPDKATVKLVSGGLLQTPSGRPELGLTLANDSERTLWVGVHFQTPAGRTDCVLIKELVAQTEGLYFCSQAAIQADSDYPVQITVYADRAQTQVLDRLQTRLRFTATDVRALHQR